MRVRPLNYLLQSMLKIEGRYTICLSDSLTLALYVHTTASTLHAGMFMSRLLCIILSFLFLCSVTVGMMFITRFAIKLPLRDEL